MERPQTGPGPLPSVSPQLLSGVITPQEAIKGIKCNNKQESARQRLAQASAPDVCVGAGREGAGREPVPPKGQQFKSHVPVPPSLCL